MNATKVAELAGAIAERAEYLRDGADGTGAKSTKEQVHELRRFLRRLEIELEPDDEATLGEAC